MYIAVALCLPRQSSNECSFNLPTPSELPTALRSLTLDLFLALQKPSGALLPSFLDSDVSYAPYCAIVGRGFARAGPYPKQKTMDVSRDLQQSVCCLEPDSKAVQKILCHQLRGLQYLSIRRMVFWDYPY